MNGVTFSLTASPPPRRERNLAKMMQWLYLAQILSVGPPYYINE